MLEDLLKNHPSPNQANGPSMEGEFADNIAETGGSRKHFRDEHSQPKSLTFGRDPWKSSGHWTRETANTLGEINQIVDRKDAERWLDIFNPIQTSILGQKLLGQEKITFELGGETYSEKGKEVVAETI